MRRSVIDVNILAYFTSLVHLFLTSEVLLPLIKTHILLVILLVKKKKMIYLAHENGHVKSKKTQNSPD